MTNFDNSMVSIYKMEYDFGFITKDDVARYVGMQIITLGDYQTIVGEPYETLS